MVTSPSMPSLPRSREVQPERSREAFLVLGMHRSGTSSVAGTLAHLGVSAPLTLMEGRPDNPRGHWESEAISRFHDELLASAGSRWDDWRRFPDEWFETPVAADFRARAKDLLAQEFGDAPAFVLKDPRLCRFPRFWTDLLAEEGIAVRIVMPLRSPVEVAQSHRTRDGFPLRKGLLLWLRHVLSAEAATRELPRIVFEWSSFLADWRAIAGRMEATFASSWPISKEAAGAQIDAFLSDDLRHETVPDAALAAHPDVHAWVVDAYHALASLSQNPDDAAARGALDRIQVQFDTVSDVVGDAFVTAEVRSRDLEALLEAERDAVAKVLQSVKVELDASRASASEAQDHAAKLQSESGARQVEIERLTALTASLRDEFDRSQAALRADMDASLANERQARAAEEAAHAAAIRTLEAERDAKSSEVKTLKATIKTLRAEAEALLAAERTLADQLRAAEAARAADRALLDKMREEMRSLSRALDAARSQKQDAERAWQARYDAAVAGEAVQRAAREEDAQRHAAVLSEVQRQVEATEAAFRASTSWRVTEPLRAAQTLLQRSRRGLQGASLLVRRVGGTGPAARIAIERVAALGPRRAIERSLAHIRGSLTPPSEETAPAPPPPPPAYQEPVVASPHGVHPLNLRYRALQDDAQRRFSLSDHETRLASDEGERIAILMPVYKVPVEFLRRTIESVLRQTHANWELCIVDDFSQDPAIAEALEQFAASDRRIKVAFAERNLGISGASNLALSMIESRYFCLLDHDDMLTCDALASLAAALAQSPEADVLYSDECKIDENDVVQDVFVKPDWDPFLMHNSMFIGHLTLYRTDVVRDVGGFRSQFDLSQDYDLALRVTERSRHVVHVQKVLYGWRMIPQSAASGGKPHARITNIAALQDAMDRRGWSGSAVALPAANRIVRDRSMMNQKVGIIIPSDNVERIVASIRSITGDTTYGRYQIAVVTNSPDIARVRAHVPDTAPVVYVPYDQPFNFSDKCNRGAAAVDADVYVFFNDDVRVKTPDWIETLLDYLMDEAVGAVGPKLLYENETVQHAGMVTGVRGLFGTAFHVMPGGSHAYFNFIQSVRQVSNLCGACLAMRKEVFDAIGGFDAEHFPIAHSDGDLCFKVRDAGLACVYTPHAELYHIGHVSIGETKKVAAGKPKPKNKVDIKTLKKWPDFIAYDPFFHPQLAGILYHDSQETFRLLPPLARREPWSGEVAPDRRDILLVFHDLSNSGAPRVLYELAVGLREEGHFVVAACPEDGPYAERLRAIGVYVVIDALIFSQHASVQAFARNFDAVVANTIVAWPLVAQCAEETDIFWYIHEARLVDDICRENPEVAAVFTRPRGVWATCERVADAVRPYRPDVEITEVGLTIPADAVSGRARRAKSSDPVVIAVVGSIEERKGQDLAIEAVAAVSQTTGRDVKLRIVGRTLDPHFDSEIRRRPSGSADVTFVGSLPPEGALAEIAQADIVLIPSRDEPFSLVGVEAMALGRVVVLGPAVGLSAYVTDGATAFLSRSSVPDDLAEALTRAIKARSRWGAVGKAARGVAEALFTREQLRRRVVERMGLPQRRET